MIIFGTSGLGVFGGGIQCTEMKMNRNCNEFTNFESLELEVPTLCLVPGCVSARKDRRYYAFHCYGPTSLLLYMCLKLQTRDGVGRAVKDSCGGLGGTFS
jgi:hypothetical protein